MTISPLSGVVLVSGESPVHFYRQIGIVQTQVGLAAVGFLDRSQRSETQPKPLSPTYTKAGKIVEPVEPIGSHFDSLSGHHFRPQQKRSLRTP